MLNRGRLSWLRARGSDEAVQVRKNPRIIGRSRDAELGAHRIERLVQQVLPIGADHPVGPPALAVGFKDRTYHVLAGEPPGDAERGNDGDERETPEAVL